MPVIEKFRFLLSMRANYFFQWGEGATPRQRRERHCVAEWLWWASG